MPPTSWNLANCAINETFFRATVDALASNGYLQAGYTYINLWVMPKPMLVHALTHVHPGPCRCVSRCCFANADHQGRWRLFCVLQWLAGTIVGWIRSATHLEICSGGQTSRMATPWAPTCTPKDSSLGCEEACSCAAACAAGDRWGDGAHDHLVHLIQLSIRYLSAGPKTCSLNTCSHSTDPECVVNRTATGWGSYASSGPTPARHADPPPCIGCECLPTT
jgi:hypothetical protein